MPTPTTPTIGVTMDGYAVAHVSVAGTEGATNQLFYQVAGGGAWVAGNSRVGNGTITQLGLENKWHQFIVVASLGGYFSLPSGPALSIAPITGTAIIEYIAGHLVNKLNELVATDSLVSVDRPRRYGMPKTPGHLACYLFQADPEVIPETPAGFESWRTTFAAAAFVRTGDTATTPVDSVINDLVAKMQVKLVADPSCNGYAQDVTALPPESFPVHETIEGAAAIVQVHWRHVYGNPFSLT